MIEQNPSDHLTNEQNLHDHLNHQQVNCSCPTENKISEKKGTGSYKNMFNKQY